MLGMYSSHAVTYLTVLMLVTTLAFAVPIFFVPLTWARLVGWTIPEHTHLAIYFGRCLGAFVLLLEAMMLRAVLTGVGTPWVFDVLLFVFGSMIVVHVYGAIRRIQPIAETLEIGLWILLVAMTIVFYPVR